MKSIPLLLLLFLFLGCQNTMSQNAKVPQPGEEGFEEIVLIMDEYHTLRLWPARIQVVIKQGREIITTKWKRTTEQKELQQETQTQAKLSPQQSAKIEAMLAAVDFDVLEEDDEFGPDGTSFILYYEGAEHPLWYPEFNEKERGLEEIVKLKNFLFELAEEQD